MVQKYGIFSWYGIRSPLRDRLSRIREAGFGSTMLWWGDALAFDEYPPSKLVQATQANNLVIENGHVPYGHANALWSDDRTTRGLAVDQHIGWIRQLSEYEIPIMVMHSARGKDITVPNSRGLRSVETLVREAEKRNVVIALENTSAAYLLKFLLGKIDSSYLRFCYDTSHGQLSEGKGFELMRAFQDRISCFHISDNDGMEDKHWNIGEGIIDWDGFAEAFPRGYNGVLSVEVLQKGREVDERAFLSKAFDRLWELDQKIHMSFQERNDDH